MWLFERKSEEEKQQARDTCRHHDRLVTKLSRIEGENAVIITMLVTILVVILERLI